MEGMDGMWGLNYDCHDFDDWNDGLGCDFEHPLRASHGSPSLCEGEEGVLVSAAGVWQVFVGG